ncbi:hypothetical protein GHK92_14635 [Nocardioides sp. dk4132]|uniref:hypothetical protein n=1 Tax=unclassified Nocardioides TaxID=2615069 RepID=UPI001296C658|nr:MULTISPECIES: hypothetical protein [unclassified Nocardioides]MQW77114.1 hypothetical protein [Nocardioides sp. dk4132]QGA06003.1 hypothetical protein GFH29_00255 [Nocardioides sp. dk884]
MGGLLAQIVASRGLQPEPVATDALVHLCSTSKAAASAIADLIAEVCPGVITDALVFTGQDIDPSTKGRPDMVAADALGVRMVLEAKFDADLTLAQISGAYSAKLATGAQAALVFLVPMDRMQNVWNTVSVNLGGASSAPLLTPDAVDGGQASMPLPHSGHVLVVASWESLLNRLQAAVTKFGDIDADSELAQVRGLVEWRTRTGWVPPVPGDLPQRVGRQLSALTDLVRTVANRTSTGKTKNGSSDAGPGRYVTTPKGNKLWVGIWLTQWGHYGPGPLFAQAQSKTAQDVSLLSEAMTAAGIENYPRPTDGRDVLVPLGLPLGAERGATEDAVAEQLLALIKVVDGVGVEVVEDHDTGEGMETDAPN